MKLLTIFAFLLLAFPKFLEAQQPLLIMQGYGDSRESPIRVEAGATIQTSVPIYLVNEPRQAFYRKLHEFANDAEFGGHEKEILDGFGGFLTESDGILKEMSENTAKLELSSESLKTAQAAVDDMKSQVSELYRQNEELRKKLEAPVKQKKKWGVPLFLGVAAGIIIGVVLN